MNSTRFNFVFPAFALPLAACTLLGGVGCLNLPLPQRSDDASEKSSDDAGDDAMAIAPDASADESATVMEDAATPGALPDAAVLDVPSPDAAVPDASASDAPTPECLARLERVFTPMLAMPAETPEGRSMSSPMAGALQLACTHVSRDARSSPTAIVALGSAFASLQPGLVVDARAISTGVVQPVPIPRAPLTLSIDLAVASPTRRVDRPTSASLREAVTSLQREADPTLGTVPEIPARISLDVFEAYSFEHSMQQVDVTAGFEVPFVGATFNAAFGHERQAGETSVVVRLVQPMYTISVADDEIPRNRDFFREGLDWSAGGAACDALDPERPPAYVRAVDYGRVVYYLVTSRDFHRTSDLATALRASFSGFGVTANVQMGLRERYQQILRRANVRALVLGGSQEHAFAALRAGDFREFFRASRSITAVPLQYRANYLSRWRPPLALASATRYTDTCCTPTNCPPAPISEYQIGDTVIRDTGWHPGSETGRSEDIGGAECRTGRTRLRIEGRVIRGSGRCYGDWLTNNERDCRAILRYDRPRESFIVCSWSVFEQQPEPHPEPLCDGTSCT